MIQSDFDMAIIGGGVVGLAVLYKATARGLSAVLLERHEACGGEISSRNSEVIHSGMYYRPGSLKARLCVDGRRQLYEFAAAHDIPHSRCGKIIVAVTPDEMVGLEEIAAIGMENDVENLRFLNWREFSGIAPGVKAEAALYSPNSGVINAHGLMDVLRSLSEAAGGIVVCGAEVTGVGRTYGGWEVDFEDVDGPSTLVASAVVNSAGLRAQNIMRMAGMDPEIADLRLYPCKGNYFSVHGESRKRIRGLVYPAPEINLQGLGIHTLVDFGGGVKLGPNVEYIEEADEYDYSVDESLGDVFYGSVSRYLPFLERGDISPDMSGIRPKLAGPGQSARDFHISNESTWGLDGFINLAGIESPGLTACLAIGDMVAGMM